MAPAVSGSHQSLSPHTSGGDLDVGPGDGVVDEGLPVPGAGDGADLLLLGVLHVPPVLALAGRGTDPLPLALLTHVSQPVPLELHLPPQLPLPLLLVALLQLLPVRVHLHHVVCLLLPPHLLQGLPLPLHVEVDGLVLHHLVVHPRQVRGQRDVGQTQRGPGVP